MRFILLVLVFSFQVGFAAECLPVSPSSVSSAPIFSISEIPELKLKVDKIDSSLDYLNLIASVLIGLTSVAAVAVSAFIAYKSAKYSKDAMDKQLAQRDEELVQRNREIMKDVSANRIKWMDDFTQAFSDYYGIALWVRELYLKNRDLSADEMQKIGSASAKVDMLLNPRDQFHVGVYELLDAINNKKLRSDSNAYDGGVDHLLLSAAILSRFIVRKEWLEAKVALDNSISESEAELYAKWCDEVPEFLSAWELARSFNPSKFTSA